jgi:FkbM family methyltransferase
MADQNHVIDEDLRYYHGYTLSDIELLNRYRVQSSSQVGFTIDFLGVRTSIEFSPQFKNLNGSVENIPVPANFRAETVEWAALIKSVEMANDKYAIAEIGASYGPWIADGLIAAKKKDISDVFAVAIEADEYFHSCIAKHLSNNGLEGVSCETLLGIAAAEDGFAYFPNVESGIDWGASAVFSDTPPSIDYRGRPLGYSKMAAFSLATILKAKPVFDLVHVDIQGSEREVIPSGINVLNEKVKRLVIGTHSRSIEGMLVDLLSSAGWLLDAEKPCKFSLPVMPERISEKHTFLDGTQVWVNPGL